ncbi:MAG: hypothetical protein HYY35_11145 [Deltaproteobacteria bacterium]|nr:hypothetical protein [Deltaproteobacteria bacterium]
MSEGLRAMAERQGGTRGRRSRLLLALMPAGMFSLVLGLWSGLERLGWALPAPHPGLALAHGPLMISGFLGTLIGVERAVALGGGWAAIAPAATALGALALILGAPEPIAPAAMAVGSAALVAVFAAVLRTERLLGTVVMGLGAVAWLVGNVLWLGGGGIPQVVSWWLGFLVLTIAGERLELNRVLRLSRARRAVFAASIALLAAGLFRGGLFTADGARLTGLALLALAAWLAASDVARRTLRQAGLPRFTALCLLSGYLWLGVGGALALRFGAVTAGPAYDAVLHAVLLGFVFSMVCGHAPIVFPAIVGLPIPFHRRFYAHLGLLHGSLVVRVCGDVFALAEPRAWGGALNAVSAVLFLLNTAWAGLAARGAPAARPAGGART